MSLYRVRNGGAVLEDAQFRQLHGDLMLPTVLTATMLDQLGADPVLPSPRPTASNVQTVVRDGAQQDGNGNWVEKWSVVNLPNDQVAAKLELERRQLIRSIDADADRIYLDVIGNRATEYSQAEKEATEFKAAGYPAGSVPPSVDSWAIAKSWTPTQAADDIIVQATAWRTAAAAIRANRLKEKEAARIATTLAQLEASNARWSGFNSYIRGLLGI